MNILKENNYDLFNNFIGNRPIDKSNLKKIKESIEKNNMLKECPILVNEKYEILDGQHRFQAAKDLNLDVYYIIKTGGNHHDVIMMNENKKTWKPEDYLRLYSEGLQNINYIKLKKFCKDHNFKLHVALMVVNGPIKQMSEHSDFKNGLFIFPEDENYLNEIAEKIKEFWGILADHGVKPLHRFKSTNCLKPFLIFITNPQVNWELFKQKLDNWWYKIGIRPSTNLYLDMFCDIYNYRNQNKIHLS